MDITTAKGLLKTSNCQWKLLDAASQVQQQALDNTITNILTWMGENPALWDYPTGTVLSTAQTGNAASTNTADIGRDFLNVGALLRITTTIGATPTCTYALEGSNNNSTWTALTFSDSGTPTTWGSSTFVISTATTVIKLIKAGQMFRYYRVNYTLNTNVTNTADFLML